MRPFFFLDGIIMNQPRRLLLIDLECTCNDEPPLPTGEGEIIEIGAVTGLISADGYTPVAARQLYVRPVIHPVLTPFCTELTGITQRTVSQASLLEDALAALQDFLQQQLPCAWGSWGKFDARQFTQETALKSLRNPLAELPHLNIKQLFARKRGHRVGLAQALRLSGLDFEGRYHSGIDDTRNIGRLIDRDELLRGAVLQRL